MARKQPKMWLPNPPRPVLPDEAEKRAIIAADPVLRPL